MAVHGLGGDAYQTWTASNGKLWLRDFLPFDLLAEGTKTARIMTFGYDANVFTKAPDGKMLETALHLLFCLHKERGVSVSLFTRSRRYLDGTDPVGSFEDH